MIFFEKMSIPPLELKNLMDKGMNLQLLDVREKDEFNFCKISGSFNISLSLLMQHFEKLDQTLPVVTICHHGVRSMRAANLLKENGFTHVANLEGGVEQWAKDVDPSMPRY